MDTGIRDIRQYNDRMARGIEDKLFFLNYFKDRGYRPDTFIDYGCADGFLLSCLPADWRKIGIDKSQEMIKRAKAQPMEKAHFLCSGSIPVGTYGDVYCFSSVLHEVYSYNTAKYIDLFWKNLIKAEPEYIIIRDMANTDEANQLRSDIQDIQKIRKKANETMLSEFEAKYGSIEDLKNMTHFLLKYRYVENWERELQENYFAVSAEEIVRRTESNYDVDYYEAYTLPFIHDTVLNDFDVNLKTPTHMKMILQLKQKE